MTEKVDQQHLVLGKLFPFMKYKVLFVSISLLFMILSAFFIFGKGLDYGVDFKGGTKIIYSFDKAISDGEIRDIVTPLNMGDVQVVLFGAENEHSFMIKVKEIEGRDLAKEMSAILKAKLGDTSVKVLSEESVGPKVGADLRRRGWFAMIMTWALILLYVGFRFDFFFAPGAIIALIHDVLITTGFFALFGKEFNLPILAALLTIIGYSVNDTIIIYDRIRENVHKLDRKISLTDLVDISVNETLSRTIITSLTVFFVVLILFLFGGAVLKDFAFAMLVGVIVGSYSTIFVASPLYLWLQKMWPDKGMAVSRAVG